VFFRWFVVGRHSGNKVLETIFAPGGDSGFNDDFPVPHGNVDLFVDEDGSLAKNLAGKAQALAVAPFLNFRDHWMPPRECLYQVYTLPDLGSRWAFRASSCRKILKPCGQAALGKAAVEDFALALKNKIAAAGVIFETRFDKRSRLRR
jgi:hypothetical protein